MRSNAVAIEHEKMIQAQQRSLRHNQPFSERVTAITPDMKARLAARHERVTRYEKRLDQYILVTFAWSDKTDSRTVAVLTATTMDCYSIGFRNGCPCASVTHRTGVQFFFVGDYGCEVFPALVVGDAPARLARTWLGL